MFKSQKSLFNKRKQFSSRRIGVTLLRSGVIICLARLNNRSARFEVGGIHFKIPKIRV